MQLKKKTFQIEFFVSQTGFSKMEICIVDFDF